MTDDIFNGFGIPIVLDSDDAFLLVKETLSRMGITSRKEVVNEYNEVDIINIMYPSCYILHKKGLYRILHFKELFGLDHRNTDLSSNDLARRNTIAKLLEDWGLLTITDSSMMTEFVDLNQIKVISFKDKKNYVIKDKYSVGKKR